MRLEGYMRNDTPVMLQTKAQRERDERWGQ